MTFSVYKCAAPRQRGARTRALPVPDFGGHMENPSAVLAALEEEELRQKFGTGK